MGNEWATAFAPGLTSAIGGAAGAYGKGQQEAMTAFADADLKQAQAEWQRAHAAGYGQGRGGAAQQALAAFTEGIQKDPNHYKTPLGMAQLSALKPGGQMNAGMWDPMFGGGLSEYQLGIHPERARQAQDWEGRMALERQKNEAAMAGRWDKVNQLERMNDLLYGQAGRMGDLRYEQAANMGGLKLQSAEDLARIKADLAQKIAADKASGSKFSKWQMYHDLLSEAERVGMDNMHPADRMTLDAFNQSMTGPQYGSTPLGGLPFNRQTGVPYQEPMPPPGPGFWDFMKHVWPGNAATAAPPTVQSPERAGAPNMRQSPGAYQPPGAAPSYEQFRGSALPTPPPTIPGATSDFPPARPPTSTPVPEGVPSRQRLMQRPGASLQRPQTGPNNAAHEQHVLGARKAIRDFGPKAVEQHLEDKSLSPAERLAIKEALMMERSQQELP